MKKIKTNGLNAPSFLLMVFILAFIPVFAKATTGQIRGVVLDAENRMPLIKSDITLIQNDVQVANVQTGLDGTYSFEALNKGKYAIRVFANGFESKLIEPIEITGANCRMVNVTMKTRQKPVLALMATSTENSISGIGDDYSHDSWSAFSSGGGDDDQYSLSNPFAGILGNREQNPRKNKLTGEYYEHFKDNGFFNTAYETNVSVFSTNLSQSSYPNVRRMLNSNHEPPKGAVRIEEMLNYFQYDYTAPENGAPFAYHYELAPCPWNKKHHLLQVGIKAREANLEEAAPMNLVFLVDISASMRTSRKLPMIKESIKLLASRLREQDRLTIMAYSHTYEVVLNNVKGTEKERIYKALDRLEGEGKTDGAIALKYSYRQAQKNFIKNGTNRVILATDGEFNTDEISKDEWMERMKEYRKGQVFLSVLGYGIGNYKDSTLSNLARYANGNYFYIDRLEEANRVLNNEIPGSLMTVAKNVKVKLDFDKKLVSKYRLIGYGGRQIDANLPGFKEDIIASAGELGSGQSITALYELVLKVDSVESLGNLEVSYKTPDASWKAKVEGTIAQDSIRCSIQSIPSKDLQFAASVASFGMFLRRSEHLPETFELKDIAQLAKDGTGVGLTGAHYRKEFMQLIGTTARVLENK